MKIYNGYSDRTVIITHPNGNKEPLKHICVHSPDGFNWGYAGSGPADLALSLLTDIIGKDDAEKLYQSFKNDIITKLKMGNPWTTTEDEIIKWIFSSIKSK